MVYLRTHSRSAEGIPTAFLDKPRTAKVNQNASVMRPKNNVLVLDIAMDYVKR